MIRAWIFMCIAGLAFGAWQTQDVPPGLFPPGSAVEVDGTWTLEGAGRDIWNTSDEFFFLFDDEITEEEHAISCHVINFEGPHPWGKAGVMFRTSPPWALGTFPGPDSYAFCHVTISNGTCLQYRDGPGQPASWNGPDTARIMVGPNDIWLKLVRSGATFRAYLSRRLPFWEFIDEYTMNNLGEDVMYAGLAVTSHQPGVLATTAVDDVNLHDPGISHHTPLAGAFDGIEVNRSNFIFQVHHQG